MEGSCPIARWAHQAPGSPALKWNGRWSTYAELDDAVSGLVAALSSRGIKRADRVAVLSPNRGELVPLLFAIWRLDAVAVMLNARLTAAELEPQLALARPALVIADEGLVVRVDAAVPLGAFSGSGVQPITTRAAPDRLAAILFTSGTTGRAKAASLTWRNLTAAAEASAQNIGGAPEHRWLACLPLFHVGGLSMVVRAAEYGCGLVLHPRFDPEEVSRSFDEDGITHASLVPTGLRRVLSVRAGRPFSPEARAVLIGGGPVDPAVLARARESGLPVLQTYGLTEATAQVATERPAEADGTTAGHPLPGIEVRIVDAEGAVLPPDHPGEIEVRGPTVMAGYCGDESETHQALWKGWLRTSDLGALDARGRLTVFARRTDLIVRGGENVYPAEVEAALVSLPEVDDVAVLGVDDPEWGQVPVALVVLRAETDDQALRSACRERLAGFKVPARFVRVAELPRNAAGKVDRARARALLR